MKAAVIGCGAIAAQHLPFLSSSPLVDLVAVCDTSAATAQFAADRYGGQMFTDPALMLSQARPDVVHVLTPPHTHRPLVTAALDCGAHVICEKPMAADSAQVRDLLGHAEARDRLLLESRNYLFNDPVIAVREAIDSGRLGRILEVDLLLAVDFLSGPFGDLNLHGKGVDLPAGAVHDFLPHLAYLFQHFARSEEPADRVVGTLANRSGNRRAEYDFLDAFVYVAGTRGRLRITADVRPQTFRVSVRGDRASLETDLFNPYFRFEGPPDIGKRTSLGQIKNGFAMIRSGLTNFTDKVVQKDPYHGLPRMLGAIYASLEENAPPPFSSQSILATAILIDQLVELQDMEE